MAPPPTEIPLAVVHQQSADRLQNQLRTLIAAAPKPDADFRMRLEQGDSLLDTLVQTVDAEWRCIVQLCGDSMAAHIMRSQTHKSHVSEYVGWVQTSYVDGAPTELKERRRAINQKKAEQISASSSVLRTDASIVTCAVCVVAC